MNVLVPVTQDMYGHDARQFRCFGMTLILELFLLHQKRRGHFSFTVLPCLEEQGVNGVRDVLLAKYVTDDRKLITFTEQETVLIV
jgi:hypothetical protein